MKADFHRTWEECTKRKPSEFELISQRTGKKYKTIGFKGIQLITISSPTYNETKQKYEYHCIDPKTNVEYECIRVPNEVKCGFNTAVNFYFMTGGLAGDKTWFNAQKAELPRSK